jgi:hypothetical protein
VPPKRRDPMEFDVFRIPSRGLLLSRRQIPTGEWVDVNAAAARKRVSGAKWAGGR